MMGVISGRLATQMVLATVVVVFLGTYALMKGDVTPQAASAHDGHGLSQTDMHKDEKAANTHDGHQLSQTNMHKDEEGLPRSSKAVLIPIDDLMKSPVSLKQDDPRLIERIRSKYLFPPSTEPYNLKSDNDDPSMGQSRAIRQILGDQRGGFFIECGALDGETRSNTLVFEKTLGWSGVLVEGDPKNFDLVTKKHRKAWTVNGCLSIHPYPNTVMFKQQFNIGKISKVDVGHAQFGYAEVQCLPLYSILLAINITTVDYFSLDIEGDEFDALQTIPWDKVDIKTLSVEFIHGKEGKGKDAITEFMASKGYEAFTKVTHPGGLANDVIFAKSELLQQMKGRHDESNRI